MKISVISPVYQAGSIVDELIFQIDRELKKITNNYEIILIDDGSEDDSWKKITDNCKLNKKVKGIKLSKNFGQHNAIAAGSMKASGDYIILMDCDLQDDPKHIKKLLEKLNNGFDIVFTKRLSRKENFFRTNTSKLFNFLSNHLSDSQIDLNEGSLIGFNKKVQVYFNKFKDSHRLSSHILKWLGFNYITIEVNHRSRYKGNSSYNLSKLLVLALHALTSHSFKLLRLSVYLGFILALVSIIFGFIVILRFFTENLNPGWPSIIVTILFSTGLILISLGIIGIYIGKVLIESKQLPVYIIEKELNSSN